MDMTLCSLHHIIVIVIVSDGGMTRLGDGTRTGAQGWVGQMV